MVVVKEREGDGGERVDALRGNAVGGKGEGWGRESKRESRELYLLLIVWCMEKEI